MGQSWKKLYFIFGILGILILVLFVMDGYKENRSKAEIQTQLKEPTKPIQFTLPTNGETLESEAWKETQENLMGEIEIPAWNAESIYTLGDQVLFESKVYEAKYWTQGDTPGTDQWGSWAEVEKTAESTDAIQNTQAEQTTPEESTQKEVPAKKDFRVVAYYPSWKTNEYHKIQYDIVTHVIYAFAIPTVDGGLHPLDNPEVAKRLILEAHKKGRKVLIGIGGWSYEGVPLEATFQTATDSDEKIQSLGDAIIKLCTDYGFDGVDMDWEHPRVDDGTRDQYETFMVYLSEKLHKEGKLLTSAVVGGVTADGIVYYDAAAQTNKVIEAVDWFQVMAYDGGDGERHSSYDFMINCGNYWKNTRKMPANKIVMGVPFYGRPSLATYETILQTNQNAWETDHSIVNGVEAYYNGIPTIERKTRYAKEHLGGIMIWEITQDTGNKEYSLLSAIGRVVKGE